MSSEHSVRTIFNEALDMSDPMERAAWLDKACAGDAALRERVDALLRADGDAGGFLSQPSLPPTCGVATDASLILPCEKPGDRIGRYKLLEQIGEGGCGVVYMAEQEEPVRRRVALKVIKLGMDTRQVMARFEAERQALAMMDHPNIARVLDAGATDSGRPYFVMELVRGVRITEFCDQRKLSARERLNLFLPVCQAVEHAHQKGIIHRDLKPSNVLVTMIDGTPVPNVIDFGVAKATNNERLTELTLFTAFEQFIGTPAYMSPEQAEMSGVDIDTRSDIYSLGVVLYELLTGKTPFDAGEMLRSGLDAMRRTIRETEPARPSTRLHEMGGADLTATAAARRTEAPQLIHEVRGDLDWIAMKCLEKDRNRRYASATGLALDIQRHLADEPVLARPPGIAYLLQKFLRRHRAAALAAAAVVFALLTGIVVSTWQALRATRAEEAAESELAAKRTALREAEASRAEALTRREQARQAVNDMYTEFSEKLLARTPRMEPVQQAFLEKALRYYERFSAEGDAGPNAVLETAEAHRRVGEIRDKLGNNAEAEAAFVRSVAMLEASGNREHAAESAALAMSLHRLGGALRTAGRCEEAETHLRRSVALREKLVSDAPANDQQIRVNLASGLNLLTIVLRDRGSLEEALKLGERALAELDRALPAASDEARRRLDSTRAAILVNVADSLQDTGREQEAEQRLQETRAIADRLTAEVPGDPIFRQAQCSAYNNLGAIFMATSRFKEAEDYFRKVEVIYGRLGGEYPLVPDYRLGVASARANLALACSRQGRQEEAETLLRETFSGLEMLQKEFTAYPDFAHALADQYHNLATLLKSRDRSQEALRLFEKSREINLGILAKHPERVATLQALADTSFNLGSWHIAMEAPDKAWVAYAATIRYVESMPATSEVSLEPAWSAGDALIQQARIMREVHQRPLEGLALLDRADEVLKRGAGATTRQQSHRSLCASVLRQRGEALLDLGRRDEADAAFREAIAITRILAADSPWSGERRHQLGEDLCGLVRVWEGNREKNGESAALAREAVALQETILAGNPNRDLKELANRSLAQHREWLAILLLESGQREPAMALFQQSEEQRRKFVTEHSASQTGWCDLGSGLNNFAIRLRDAGDPAAALPLLQQAIEAQHQALKIAPDYQRARWFLRIHFMNLARTHQKLDDRTAAMESWREAVQAGEELVHHVPGLVLHRNNLAMDLNSLSAMELEAGQVAGALRGKERVVSLVSELIGESGPQLPGRESLADLQQSLARLYALGPDAKLRDSARAVVLAKAATENDPKSPAAWHALGLAHCMAKAPQEAIAATEKSMQLTGAGDALNWFVRAMTRHQLGDPGGAGRDYARALEWLRHDGSKPYRQIAVPYQEEAGKLPGIRVSPASNGPGPDATSREQ